MPTRVIPAATRQWYGRTRERRSTRRNRGNQITRRDAIRAEHSIFLTSAIILLPFAGPTLACFCTILIAHHFRLCTELRDKFCYVITTVLAIGFTALAFIVSQLYIGDDGFKFHTSDYPVLKFLSLYFGAMMMSAYSLYRMYKSEAYRRNHWPRIRDQTAARPPPDSMAAEEGGGDRAITSPPSIPQPRHSSGRPASQHSNGGEGPSNWHQRPVNQTIPAHSGNNDFEMTDLGLSSEHESSNLEARPVHRSRLLLQGVLKDV